MEYLLLVSIDEKNNLILSSYVLYIIIKIYYQDKNYKNIIKIFDTILNLVKKIEINAKILLYYDFVSIALNILQELYEKENEYEEYYKATFTFLEEIAKYLNQNLLMKYLNKVFIIFNKNVLEKIKDQDPFENPIVDMPSIGHKRENVHNSADIYEPTNITEENENKDDKNNINIPLNEDEEQNKTNTEDEKISKNINNELCFKLLELLKKNLQKDNSDKDYIILSNHIFQNPFINNLIFFDNLKFTDKDTYIEFKLTLKVDTYNGIDGFILLQIINQKNKINFILRNNSLEIKETADKVMGQSGSQNIYLKKGPYGFYVQLGEDATATTEKPKRASLPKGLSAEDVTFEQAERLLSLPLDFGDDITLNSGKFGPYIKQGNKSVSLRGGDNIFNMTKERAVELLSTAKEKPAGKILGVYPKNKQNIQLLMGRYGPYLKCGRTNYAIPKNVSGHEPTLEEAIKIIESKK